MRGVRNLQSLAIQMDDRAVWSETGGAGEPGGRDGPEILQGPRQAGTQSWLSDFPGWRTSESLRPLPSPRLPGGH